MATPCLFGNFIDVEGELFDSVHFPEAAHKYPYHGKGIYEVKGVVSEEFGHYTIEARELRKIHFLEDARYSDAAEKSSGMVTKNDAMHARPNGKNKELR